VPHCIAFVAACLFGSLFGSFLNVIIHRVPRDESILWPASRCPSCGAGIRPWQNIPVISWLALRGKCASCKTGISVRYPLVEALMAALTGALWLKFGLTYEFGIYFVFLFGLVAVTFIDIDHKIIPDRFSLGGIVVGLISAGFTQVGWVDSLIGIAVGGGGLLLVAVLYYKATGVEGMGMGDVKLLAALGAFLGWKSIPFIILAASLVGIVVGLGAMKIKKTGKRTEIPFGPFLSMGGALYLFFGPEVIEWYLNIYPQ
jgi:leader peptidase (prepilin peptidase)/N-methyltransferase